MPFDPLLPSADIIAAAGPDIKPKLATLSPSSAVATAVVTPTKTKKPATRGKTKATTQAIALVDIDFLNRASARANLQSLKGSKYSMPLTQTAINRAILNAYSTEELKNYWIIKFGGDVKWPTKPKAIPALLTKIASEGVATGKPESVV